MHDEFLRLLQMVEGTRRCEGKECFDVTEANIQAAGAYEAAKRIHETDGSHGQDAMAGCPTCETLRQQEIGLRETLHSQGIDFPVGIMNG